MNQEVRIQIDVSITLNAKYDATQVRDIVERAAYAVARNNSRQFSRIRFAEEAAIYSTESGHIEWTDIVKPSPEAQAQSALVKAEAFIAGFEDDDTQEGVPELLSLIRTQL